METQEPDKKGCFVPLAGMEMVFEPACRAKSATKRHACHDCHYCQDCSQIRCNSCRSQKAQGRGTQPAKLSLSEQIRLFDTINAKS